MYSNGVGGVLFGLFEYNEGVRSNVGICCNVMVPLQGGM